MLTNLGFVGIVVDNVAEATAFYRDTLGLTIDEAQSAPGVFIQFKLQDGAILALQHPDFPGQMPFDPSFIVEDVDALYTTWKARGVEIIEELHDMPFGRTFVFRAPQGHMLRVYKPRG